VARETPLFWFYYWSLSPPKFAMRDGNWKLLAMWDLPKEVYSQYINPELNRKIKQADLTDYALYNLSKDLSEEHELSDEHPDRGQSMFARAEKLFSQMQDEGPVWEKGTWPGDGSEGPPKPGAKD
jgi:arylsulfatase A